MPDEAPAAPAAPAAEPVDPGEAALAAAINAVDTPTPQTVESLPDWGQKLVRDARADAAKYRTGAKTAADDATKHIMDTISAALGINPELNADVLAESLKASQAEATQRARELAIYKAASASGANVERLMDSRAVMDALAQIDPTDSAAITAAITSATAENSYFRAAQAAASSGAPLTGSHEDGQLTEAQADALAKRDPAALVKAQAEGKLDRILGRL